MAGLRELRKRLNSIRTTGQLAGAMRSAAAAKYARVNAALTAYRPYGDACEQMRARLGDAGMERVAPAENAPECLVVLAGNRGLCGGFNAELLRYFSERVAASAAVPEVVVCGKVAAAYCREKGIADAKAFPVSDIPAYEEAQAVSAYLLERYRAGAITGVTVVCQRLINMLRQTPESRRLLPAPETDAREGDAEPLFLPDRETLCKQLAVTCFDAEIYKNLLENAAGAQAATLMAMRAAFDNATESAEKLETAINRRRQAEVTESVIETSSDNIQ